MNKLTLELELGNDAMQTPAQVARALREAADKIEAHRLAGAIIDANGNTVGRWEFS